MMRGMRRRTHVVGALGAALLLVAACLGSGERGEACACRPEPPPDAADSPSAAPEAAAQVAPPAAALPEAARAPAALPDFDDPAWTRVPSRAGRYLVCWRTPRGKVPRNEDFTLEVWVLRDGAPVGEAELAVNGWMPDHGHGMLRLPRTQRSADGSFLVEGMLLHMRGLWQLRFDVLEGPLAETAECELEL